MKTVKEVKEIISELTNDRSDFIKLQEYFLSTNKVEEVGKITETIEKSVNLNTSIRGLCSKTINTIDAEIQRLNNMIDSAIVKF